MKYRTTKGDKGQHAPDSRGSFLGLLGLLSSQVLAHFHWHHCRGDWPLDVTSWVFAFFRVFLPLLLLPPTPPSGQTQPSSLVQVSLNETLKDTGNSLLFRKNLHTPPHCPCLTRTHFQKSQPPLVRHRGAEGH